jgi:hypothetical protein
LLRSRCFLLGQSLGSEGATFEFLLLLQLLHHLDFLFLAQSLLLDTPLNFVHIETFLLNFVQVFLRYQQVRALLLVELSHQLVIRFVEVSHTLGIMAAW